MQILVSMVNILLAILVVTGVLSGITFAWIFLIEAIIVHIIVLVAVVRKL